MMSRVILCIHTLIFLAYVGFSLASPVIIWVLPWGAAWPLLLTVIIFGLVVIGSWRVWGECPFTIWENAWRKREGRKTYRGACTEHYARAMGVNVPEGLATKLLEILPLFPIVAAVVKFLS